ncbi:MAG: hypothetical protein Q9201_003199 [Fulgogasparrea decipioides]
MPGDSSSGTTSMSDGLSTSNSELTSHGRSGSFDGGETPRKRRTTGTVATIACSECRKARQKTRNLDCLYEPHTKTHKEFLLKEIANLRKDNTRLQNLNQRVSDTATDLQQKNQGLQSAHEWQKIVLDEIGRNGHDRQIIQKLRNGESSETIARWLCQQQPLSRSLHIIPPNERGLLDIVDAYEQQYRRQAGLSYGKDKDTLHYRWTQGSSSRTLVGHLFDLYFTWVHPVHMLFSENDFKESFRTNNAIYCSSALVNAICAMACHLVEPKDVDDDVENVVALGHGFMNQARQEIMPKNYLHLTSIQALAVMYLCELSSGKARSATGYLRAAAEFLKNARVDGQSLEARQITLWGIQTLNTSSTGITYQKLYAPEFPAIDEFEHIDMHADSEIWRFYRTVGDEHELPVRPGYAILTAFEQAALFRIVHESLNLYCGLRGSITAEAMLTLYRRYLDWDEDLLAILKKMDVEEQPLPHILFLRVQYHVAMLQHLTPLLQSNLFTGSNYQHVLGLVVNHAKEGARLLDHSRRLYSTRYLMPLCSFCIVHIGDALVRYSVRDPPGTEVVEFCLGMLQEASIGFPLCGPLQDLFRRAAVEECGVLLPSNVEEMTGNVGSYGMDDILDACTRLDYKQPVDQSVRHLDERIAEEWSSQWQQIVENPERPKVPPVMRERRQSGKQIRIDALLNQ